MVRNRTIDNDIAGSRSQTHAGVAGEIGAVPVLIGTGPYLVGGSHTITPTGVPGPSVAVLGLSIGVGRDGGDQDQGGKPEVR